MTRLTPLRVAATTIGCALLIAAAGLGWGAIRFGTSDRALADRLQREVQATIGAQSAAVEALAQRVAAASPLVVDAATSRDQLSDLFERLGTLSTADAGRPVAVTVYVPGSTPGEFRVLAWSDGPGEQNLSADRLSGPRALFVAPGHAGVRLVAVEPITSDGRPVGVAVAETILAPADRRIITSFGAVPVIEHYASTRDTTGDQGFAVTSAAGVPLIEVQADPVALRQHRRAFQQRVLAAALLPLPLGLSIITALGLDRRRRAANARGRWSATLWFAAATTVITIACAALALLPALPDVVSWFVLAIGTLVIVTRVSETIWWQAGRHRPQVRATTRFVVEQLAGGGVLAAALEGVAQLLDRWITLNVLDRGLFVLFPFSVPQTLSVGSLLLAETAVAWGTASILAALAIRWRVLASGARGAAALTCWLVPPAVLFLSPWSLAADAGRALAAVALVAALGSLGAAGIRRTYRRSTQSARLLLALLAGLVPVLTLYPIAANTADRATRAVVETNYAPATAGHPQELRAELGRAQARVDTMTGLDQLVGLPPSDSQPAFLVWSQTGLQRSRVISDVELYGPDRGLVSRFAFNLPEYVYRSTLQPWQGSSCQWEVFGEVTPFGAEERLMLHAERGVCAADGTLLGGIVVHVASNDYQALPFISSPSPYYDGLTGIESGPRLPDVRLAVYGWSYQPIFTSGRAAWAVPPELLERLYRTAQPFWTSLTADDGTYRVHLSQNRAGIYAVGVPAVTLIEHVTRLAEIVVLVAVFFVAWQVALLLHAALARRPHPPLRQMLREVRTSFYRKLFLSFVAVAIAPVMAAAVAFDSYMTAQFRADVEYEAATTVTVARRVFQELTASGERSAELQADRTDDVMVWIRQVIGHDVNLFEGPELVITSQRDLFDSGLLPERTPAMVYRAIALERRLSFVVEDRLGAFSYVVAAAPVSAAERDTLITVPLAPRQRELESELDTLNRRVLVGAVFVILLAAVVGASLAGRIADPVARLTRATRQIAAGRLDVRVATDTADELRRLVDDFNSMASTLGAQRDELARANQLKAWNEMARQVAHEIKNPLTPVQLAAEHLQHVHDDRGRPLGAVVDQCIGTVLTQVRLLRRIASEFANFASEPTSRPTQVNLGALVTDIVEPYRAGLNGKVTFDLLLGSTELTLRADRTLLSRALVNLVENAVQAMPSGGTLRISAHKVDGRLVVDLADTGVGMDAVAVEHAFEPYFSTKTGGSGLGLTNAKRNVEREGGTLTLTSVPGTGTTVTISFPESALPPEPREPTAAS